MKTFEKIYAIVSLVPRGKVLTYKKVAEVAGIKNTRVVGFALHKNKDPQNIPCHRIVKSDGSLTKGYAFGGIKIQKENLKKEGVNFYKGQIELKKYLYKL